MTPEGLQHEGQKQLYCVEHEGQKLFYDIEQHNWPNIFDYTQITNRIPGFNLDFKVINNAI